MMTAEHHDNGTERCAEVAAARGWSDDTVVVNVQGDEPLLPPQLIRRVAGAAAADGVDIATLACPVSGPEEFASADAVKVVCDGQGRALYFSRAPIPAQRDEPGTAWRFAWPAAHRVVRLPGQCAAPSGSTGSL